MPRPALLVLALLLPAACGPDQEQAPEGPNLLLVTFDTTRRERLGLYGGPPNVSPTLDELARRGVSFDHAWATAPLTLPSHASMLTGLVPMDHGVRDNARGRLPATVPFVPEVLQEAGFRTAAFPAAEVLMQSFGMNRGFDLYADQLNREDSPGSPMRDARRTVDLFEGWLDVEPESQFFAWVHFFDPHAPYRAHPEQTDAPDNPYDQEIRHADQQLARLLQVLDERGLRENTWICVTADHGESLGQHGEDTHCIFVYDATMKVPLVVSHPSLTPGRISRPTSLVDLAPTLVELAGLEPFPSRGTSLVPLLRDASTPLPAAPIFLESWHPLFGYDWSPLQAVIAEGWKFIDAPNPELYALMRDAAESKNLVQAQAERAAKLRRLLEQLRRDETFRRAPEHVDLDEATRARIAALGYAMGGMGSDGPLPLPGAEAGPDPKDRIQVLPLIQALYEAGRANDYERVQEVCQEILTVDPGNVTAVEFLGSLMVRSERFEESLPFLEGLEQRGRSTPNALLSLGIARLRLNQLDEAVEVLERRAAMGDAVRALRFLAEAESSRGNFGKAANHIRTALQDRNIPAPARAVLTENLQDMEARAAAGDGDRP